MSALNKFAITAICLFFVLAVNAQTTVSIIADYDAAIGYHDYKNTANNNYGTALHNGAYAIPGVSGGLNVNRALIHFDLSAIPAGATITSAKLNLFAIGSSGTLNGHTGQSNEGVLQMVTGSWSENTVTWNNQPASTNLNEVHLPPSTSSMQDYTNVDVIQLVQAMRLGSNYGFLLKQVAENATNALLFCSEDHSNQAKHPHLEITYTTISSGSSDINITAGSFNIYPNPASGFINVNMGSLNNVERSSVEIYSLHGKLVSVNTLDGENTIINVDGLPQGVYSVQLVANSIPVLTRRIVITAKY